MTLPVRKYWWRPSVLAPYAGQGLNISGNNYEDFEKFMGWLLVRKIFVSGVPREYERELSIDANGARIILPVNTDWAETNLDDDNALMGDSRYWVCVYPYSLRGFINPRMDPDILGFAEIHWRVPNVRKYNNNYGMHTGLGITLGKSHAAVAHTKKQSLIVPPESGGGWKIKSDYAGSSWNNPALESDVVLDEIAEGKFRADHVKRDDSTGLMTLKFWNPITREYQLMFSDNSVSWDMYADFVPFMIGVPNSESGDDLEHTLVQFQGYPYDPFIAQVMPVADYLSNLDIIFDGKNAAASGHGGYELREDLGWAIRCTAYTRGGASSGLAHIITDSMAQGYDHPWMPSGAFTILFDINIDDWDPGERRYIAYCTGSNTYPVYWTLSADDDLRAEITTGSGSIIMDFTAALFWNGEPHQVGISFDGVSRWRLLFDGQYVSEKIDSTAVMQNETLLLGAWFGNRGVEAWRGDVQIWEQELNNDQLVEAYSELLKYRIKNYSFEIAKDGAAIAGEAEDWDCTPSELYAFAEFEHHDQFNSEREDYETDWNNNDGHIDQWDNDASAPALFSLGKEKIAAETFERPGWEVLGSDYQKNGWPWQWPSNSKQAVFSGVAFYGIADITVESFEFGWDSNENYIYSPQDIWVLEPQLPLIINKWKNSRVAFAIYNFGLAEWRGADIEIAEGTYNTATDLASALQSAFDAIGLASEFGLTFGTHPDSPATKYTIKTDNVVSIAAVGVGPDISSGEQPDGRADLGMPARETSIILGDENVEGYRVNQLDVIMNGDLAGFNWLGGNGGFSNRAQFDGQSAEKFETGWNNDEYTDKMVGNIIYALNPYDQIGITGDYTSRYNIPGLECVIADGQENDGNYTVISAVFLGGITIVTFNERIEVVISGWGSVYPNYKRAEFNATEAYLIGNSWPIPDEFEIFGRDLTALFDTDYEFSVTGHPNAGKYTVKAPGAYMSGSNMRIPVNENFNHMAAQGHVSAPRRVENFEDPYGHLWPTEVID